MNNKEPPIRELRVRKANATIWRNLYNNKDGEQRCFLTARLSKSFLGRDGQWKSSYRFTSRELVDVIRVCRDAIGFMEAEEDRLWKEIGGK